jgi:hypothetical protein
LRTDRVDGKVRGPTEKPKSWLYWRLTLNIPRFSRAKDCSVCVLTLALVAGVPILTSVGVLFFF